MRKVLIIEDDKIWLETLTASLEAENFKVISATDGLEGLNLASQEKVDLILLDFILPSLNGLEICKRLRTKGISTPIIMLTGEKKEEIDKILGLELGAAALQASNSRSCEALSKDRHSLPAFKRINKRNDFCWKI